MSTAVFHGAGPTQHRVGKLPWAPRLDEVGVVLGLALTPMLVPAGPGNSGLADVGVGAGIVTWLLVARAGGTRLRFPYVVAVATLVTGGLLAIVLGGVGHDVVVLVQDLVLLLWAAAVAAIAMRPGGLQLVLRAWVVVGVLSAGVTLFGYATGIALLAGTSASDGSRASATLGDPNLAANWFVLCLLVLRAAQYPRRPAPRWACASVLLAALVVTGSNGGMLALLAATAVGAVLGAARRRGAMAGIALACVLLLAAVATKAVVPVDAVKAQAISAVSLLNDSVGRTDKSEHSRSVLLHEALVLARTEGLTGVGPGGTRQELQSRQAPYVKEAHDDYLAVVVERGALGGLGLLLLLSTVVARMRLVCQPDRRRSFQDVLPRPELLGAALVAVALSAGLYEVLHFRHVWALLGLVAGLSMRQQVPSR